ncbi:MAG: cobalamin-binding protein [Chloroflexi bacterium]|nr:cobalamin-binding protein [Chloroflexota bacterium]
MYRTLFRICLLALVALLAAGCAASPRTPATDDLGRPITLKETPHRIVSMAPSNTELLFALGLGSKVVGVDDFSDYPPQAKETAKVGGFIPSLEKIVALEPDLVLGIGETLPEYASTLEARGIPVVILQPKDIEGILADIELVGAITGARKEARELATEMRREVNAVVTKAQGSPRVRVFYEIDGSDPVRPWTAGPGSFIQALIEMAGGANIASEAAGPWVQISAEEIVRADPQVILLGDAAYGTTVESVKRRPGWGGLSAAKVGAIYPIDADITTRPGPRIVQGLKEIARLVHPELFPEGGK